MVENTPKKEKKISRNCTVKVPEGSNANKVKLLENVRDQE